MDSLYLNRNLTLESNCELEDAKFALLGIPFDSTSTYRVGQRFAPLEIRKEFLELEKKNFFKIPFYDLGNVEVVHGNVHETFKRIENVIKEVFETNPDVILLTLGGEHTVSYPIIKSIKNKNLHVLQLDAHMDLKDDYLGEKWSHATVMRRLSESGIPITQIGVRSFDDNEIEYVKEKRIEYCGTDGRDIKKVINKIHNKSVYITLDMDILDPSIAPGVSNPEPDGIDLNTLGYIINKVIKNNSVTGFDIMEVCPTFDNGTTSITAARIMLDFILSLSFKKRKV